MATYLPGHANRTATRLPPVLPDSNIRRMAVLMDEAIRIGPLSLGLDGLLGLIPGVGDGLSALMSAFIVMKAAQDGVPRATLARMVANVAIDSTLGAVPILGDLFDFLFKANMKNLALYEEAMRGPRSTKKDWGFVIGVIVVVLLLLAIPVVIGVLLLMKLLR